MLWTYAASKQLWSGADLMYTDEPRWGTEREAHKLKRPTGPTSTKANLDGEIIQLNPSKHCWRPRQTLAWPTRFTRGPVPTPMPHNFPFLANVYTRSIALSITGTYQLWPLDHFRNEYQWLQFHEIPYRNTRFTNWWHVCTQNCTSVLCVRKRKSSHACTSVSVHLYTHVSIWENRCMCNIPIYVHNFESLMY
jgi:hypothetical protein